jgi:GMP synthase-like glutamine amidotransferase
VGDAVPRLDEIDAVVVMGGPMNIYQYRDHPWLVAERAFLMNLVASGKRALGICLGAQLLADALGARVVQNPAREIGWWPVTFTDEARGHFSALPAVATVLSWHGDTFELPRGAMLLGASRACGRQGFLFEGRILGLQFHPEMSADAIARLVEAESAELTGGDSVQGAEQILAGSAKHGAGARTLLDHLLDTFFGEDFAT